MSLIFPDFCKSFLLTPDFFSMIAKNCQMSLSQRASNFLYRRFLLSSIIFLILSEFFMT